MGHRIPQGHGSIFRSASKDPTIAGASNVVYTTGVMMLLLKGCEAIQSLEIIQTNGLMRGTYKEKVTTRVYAQASHWVHVLQY